MVIPPRVGAENGRWSWPPSRRYRRRSVGGLNIEVDTEGQGLSIASVWLDWSVRVRFLSMFV